ncbi:MAG: sensor histidine kinase, partial [Chloroflexota bacterium]
IAVLEERHRIGMDLHDGAMQSLYGVGLLLEDVSDRLEGEPEVARSELARAVDRLNATIADLRGYVLGLKPIRPRDHPLSESLVTLASQVRTQALLEVGVDVDPDAERELDPARREAVFYIAADALGNVARHARARHVAVRVAREGAAVVLEIADDGVGFDSQRLADGLGLRNMRERAFVTGGTLRVESAVGHGTRIRLELPRGER